METVLLELSQEHNSFHLKELAQKLTNSCYGIQECHYKDGVLTLKLNSHKSLDGKSCSVKMVESDGQPWFEISGGNLWNKPNIFIEGIEDFMRTLWMVLMM